MAAISLGLPIRPNGICVFNVFLTLFLLHVCSSWCVFSHTIRQKQCDNLYNVKRFLEDNNVTYQLNGGVLLSSVCRNSTHLNPLHEPDVDLTVFSTPAQLDYLLKGSNLSNKYSFYNIDNWDNISSGGYTRIGNMKCVDYTITQKVDEIISQTNSNTLYWIRTPRN